MKKSYIVGMVISFLVLSTATASLIATGVKKNNSQSSQTSSSEEEYEDGIYFIANGGKIANTSSPSQSNIDSYIKYDSNIEYIDLSYDRYIPSRKGYTFGGWYTSPTLEDSSKIEGKVMMEKKPLLLYAYWNEEDKPYLYNYDLKYSYCTIYGLSSFDSSGDTLYRLHMPSFISGYPVNYISSKKDAYTFGNSRVVEVKLPEKVSYIYTGAFTGCKITSLDIPQSLKSIGSQAFMNCDMLEKINFSKNSSLETINTNAFSGCVSLKEISFPEKVETIGEKAFYECEKLDTVTFASSSMSIGKGSFDKTKIFETKKADNDKYIKLNDEVLYSYTGNEENVIIDENIKNIASSAFENQENIKHIEFKDNSSLETIGKDAFYGCVNIEGEIKLPSKIKKIYASAFGKVKANIDASNSALEEVPQSAFEKSLATSIKVPSTVTKIGSYAFKDCENLESFKVGSLVTSLESSAFANCKNLKSIELPSFLKYIYSSAFSGCTSLKSLVIPNNVSYIYSSAFSGCTALENITLPQSLVSLRDKTFEGCTNLKKIEINSTLNSLGVEVFKGLNENQEIIFTNMNEEEVKKISSTRKDKDSEGNEIVLDYKSNSNAKFAYKN